MEKALYMRQCPHAFHGVCAMKAMNASGQGQATPLAWPCPVCRTQSSQHTMLNAFFQTCTLDEVVQIFPDGNLDDWCPATDWSLLHEAAMVGRVPIVHYLIERGLDVHEANCFGHTALYLAAIHGHTALVRYLVEQHRVDVHARTMLRQTARDIAAEYGRHETVAYLDNILEKI